MRIHNTAYQYQVTVLNKFTNFVVLQDKCAQYWPSERSARYQYFVVDPLAEYNMPQYILREFKVTILVLSTADPAIHSPGVQG
jgi:hypothetical protein